jgi:hypothetical protein
VPFAAPASRPAAARVRAGAPDFEAEGFAGFALRAASDAFGRGAAGARPSR